MKIISKIAVFSLLSALWFGPASSARADLVAHWTFNEAAGSTTAADATGTYPATASNSSITFGTAGKYGTAVTFDGTTPASQLQFDGLQGIYDTSLTFSFWIKVPETTIYGEQVIGAWQKSHGYRLFLNENRQIVMGARTSADSSTWKEYGTTTGQLVANEWNHVVITLDRESGKIYTYLNGTYSEKSQPGMLNLWESTGCSGMGWKQDSANGGVLNGSLDEMYVYNEALTTQQAHGLMYNNNINEFIVSNPYVQTDEKVLLGALFGVANTKTVQEAMAAGGTVGTQATTGNLGIAYATKSSEISTLNQVVDVTKDGLMIDFRSINAGQTYGQNVQNAKCNVSGIRTTGKYFNELITVAGKTGVQSANFKIDEGIGMHANALVTFNLDEICEKNGWDSTSRLAFTCSKAGMNDEGSGSIDQVILISDADHNILGSYVNGKYAAMTQSTDGTYSFASVPTTHLRQTGLYDVDFLLPEGAKYLTLATTASNISSAHGVFGQAHLRLVENAPITKEAPIYLNRLAGISAAGTTGTGILSEKMASNSFIGTQITTSTFGVDTILGKLNDSSGQKLASDASWKFNFTKNFKTSNYTEGYIYNSKCGAYSCSTVWNPLLGTAENPNDFIGIHAENAITYDLSELRDAGCLDPNQPLQFTVTATGAHVGSAAATPIVLVSNDEGILAGYVSGVKYGVTEENGVWYFNTSEGTDYNKTLSNGAAADFDLVLGMDAKYLTLAYSGFGVATSDHFVWLNPTLKPLSFNEVPEPAAWVLLLLGLWGLKVVRRRK